MSARTGLRGGRGELATAGVFAPGATQEGRSCPLASETLLTGRHCGRVGLLASCPVVPQDGVGTRQREGASRPGAPGLPFREPSSAVCSLGMSLR